MRLASYLPLPMRECVVSQLFKGVQEENWFYCFTLIKLPRSDVSSVKKKSSVLFEHFSHFSNTVSHALELSPLVHERVVSQRHSGGKLVLLFHFDQAPSFRCLLC